MKYLLFVFFTLAISAIPQQGLAASYKCWEATSGVEKVICKYGDLSRLDDELGILYQALNSGDKKLVDDQRSWLSKRNACRELACIKAAYEERIEIIKKKLIEADGTDKALEKLTVIHSFVQDEIDKLLPLTEELRAILALHALETGTGCDFNEDQDMECALTQLMGFRVQCSQEHRDFVNSWFNSKFVNSCYYRPITSSVQKVLTTLLIRQRKNGEIVVDAAGYYVNHQEKGRQFYSQTNYRINGHTIEVIEN